MAKKNQSKPANKKPNKKPQYKKLKSGLKSAEVIALIVFIAIAIGVLFGTIWYYAFHLPQAAEEMEDASIKFTQEYFDVHHDSITGNEGLAWLTASKNRSDRVENWKDKNIIARVEGDIEVQVLERGFNSGRTRVTFWQYEEVEGKSGRDLLVFYDYEFSRENGSWLIDKIITASPAELEKLRRSRGVLEQHQQQEEDAEDEEDDESEDEEGQDE